MRNLILASLCFVGLIGMGIMSISSASAADAPAAGKVYELRIYHAEPGKLEALQARFRDHTCKLFQKHGIEIVGFWTPVVGDEATMNTLYYILAYPSLEAQKTMWKAFMKDPEWIAAKDASEVNGKLVGKVDHVFMAPTDFSPLH